MADIHFQTVKQGLSTDIWFHFQSIEMMLKKPRRRGRFLFVVKMMLKKNLAKRGA